MKYNLLHYLVLCHSTLHGYSKGGDVSVSDLGYTILVGFLLTKCVSDTYCIRYPYPYPYSCNIGVIVMYFSQNLYSNDIGTNTLLVIVS
jgi:hypothetical protein